jgi:hypothetical protein
MDVQALGAELQSRRIEPGRYSLGSDTNEAYCLVPDADGWLVYYSERGNRNDTRRYINEGEACADLMLRVLGELESDLAW